MLFERDAEIDRVTGALRSALTGNGSFVLIGGGLGNGKSALLKALASVSGAAEARVLRAGGSLLEEGYAFGVVRQLLEPVLGETAEHTRERWLDGPAGLARTVFCDDSHLSAEGSQVAIGRAVLVGLRALVEQLAAARPLLILVDDLHRVDEPSLRFLGHLAGCVDTLPVLLVATVCEGDRQADRPLVRSITRAAAHTLRPGSLTLAGTTAFLRERLGPSCDERFAMACHELADGSPMVLMSLSLAMSHLGVRPSAENVELVGSLRPAQLRDRMVACFRLLPGPVREFTKALVVLGEQADLALIGELAGLDEAATADASRALDRLGLLAEGPRPAFKYPAAQDAVEEALTVQEWETTRTRAVRLLHDGGTPPEQVASHLLSITKPQGEWARESLRRAADIALHRGAPEVAARYLRRALLETSPDGEDRAAVLLDLVEVEQSFDVAAANRHVAYALALFASPRDRASAAVRIAPTMVGDLPARMRQVIHEVSVELGDSDGLTGVDRELALRLEARLHYAGVCDRAELAATAARLVALGPQPRTGTSAERELVTVLLYGGMLTARPGAAEIARVAREVLKHEPPSFTHVHTTMPLLVSSLVSADSVDEISPWLGLALGQARLRNAPVEEALIRIEQAMVLLRMGRLTEAKEAVADAVAVDMFDWNGANPTMAAVSAAVAIESRDAVLTERLLAIEPEWTDNPCLIASFGILRGSAAAWRGELPLAVETLLDCGRRLDRLGWRNPVPLPWLTSVALIYQRLGKIDEGLELAEEERVRAESWGAPCGVGRALRVLGTLTPGPRGAALSREAVDVLELSANKLELGKALLQLGIQLGQSGEQEAKEHLWRCHRLAVACGASSLAERAWAELGGSQAKAGRPTLTKAEERVARMAADGRANQEIADTLEVSARAVEKHLTNSYRKLGVRRRAELETALRTTGHL